MTGGKEPFSHRLFHLISIGYVLDLKALAPTALKALAPTTLKALAHFMLAERRPNYQPL